MTYTSSWRSPSNIALIKYWGKHGLQLPRNPSLSFTLSACHTQMKLEVTPEATSPGLTVRYDGQPRPSFEPKIKVFFSLVADRFPWLSQASVLIDSTNTFPHGAGIASSASAMSALALCLSDINDQITGNHTEPDALWWQKASEVARLGSGSACRSIYPIAAIWGETEAAGASSDLFAIPWNTHLAPVYRDYQDTILIVSASEKSVSSTAGHKLMDGLSYAPTRYAEARRNLIRLSEAMQQEDAIDLFITVVETEALQLHALMMSGDTPFILMEPGTLSIIKEVWRFRKASGIPVCFTLDAGPNVHLLYPSRFAPDILDWIERDLSPFCANGSFIQDHTGTGPEKIA
jgi:diphosphomevalonate decarboxylase